MASWWAAISGQVTGRHRGIGRVRKFSAGAGEAATAIVHVVRHDEASRHQR
jgi:hypothetical protein